MTRGAESLLHFSFLRTRPAHGCEQPRAGAVGFARPGWARAVIPALPRSVFGEEAAKRTSEGLAVPGEQIPRCNSLETRNHQIDSEAAWLSAIRGNLQ